MNKNALISAIMTKNLVVATPNTTLDKGLAATYAWIKEQHNAKKAGKRVGIG